MHPNPNFRKADTVQNIGFARNRGFGTLSVNGDDGPLISHVPFLISGDGSTVEAHLVRSNPILKQLGNGVGAILAVTSADAYVSPDWYGIDDQVPTWNYVAVHMRGTLVQLTQDELPGHLERLSEQFEQQLLPKQMWKMDKVDTSALERLMRMIVPVRLKITDIDGTWKLGQNKPENARIAAANGIANHGIGAETAEIAILMRKSPC